MKSADTRITVLVENTAKPGLAAEHGLALWIETADVRVLFDTGQSGAFLANAKALRIPLDKADALVLSHGHYDHSGGLGFLSASCVPRAVFMHSAAVIPRYSRKRQPPHKPIGMPQASMEFVGRLGEKVTWTASPTRISQQMGITGRIPRVTEFENAATRSFLDPECSKPDSIMDDQAIWVETARGPVVVLGCAHAGVVNTLDYIASLIRASSIHAVVGGMHLGRTGRARLQRTVNALNRYDVKILAPCHCTGDRAVRYFKDHFRGRIASVQGGTQLSF